MDSNEIFKRIQSGEGNALEVVYKEFKTPFIIWVKGQFEVSTDAAIEIFQHSVVIMYDNIKSSKVFELRSSLKTYLFGIGKNVARDHLRKERRYSKEPSDVFVDHIVDTSSVAEKSQLELDIRSMYAALNKLGDPCKSLLQLFYFQRYPMSLICERLGYNNTQTAKSKKYKCLQRLKATFDSSQSPI